MHVLGHEKGIWSVLMSFLSLSTPFTKIHWRVTDFHTDISAAASRLLQ